MKETIILSPKEIIAKISLKKTNPEDYVFIPQVDVVREYINDPNNPGRKVMRIIGETTVPGKYALVVKKFDSADMETVRTALNNGFYLTKPTSSSASYLMVEKYSLSQILEALISKMGIEHGKYIVAESGYNTCNVIFKNCCKEMSLVAKMLEDVGFTVTSEESWNFLYVSMSKIGISKMPISLDEGIEYAEEFDSVHVSQMATVTSKSRSALRKIACILSERGLYVEFSEDAQSLTLKEAPEKVSASSNEADSVEAI